jgi:hypothetical protein
LSKAIPVKISVHKTTSLNNCFKLKTNFPIFWNILAAKSIRQQGQKQRKRLFYNSYDLLKEKQLTALHSTIVTKIYHATILYMKNSQQSYNPGRSKNDYKYLVDLTTQVTFEFPPDKLVPLNSSIPFNTDLHPIST